jgi:GAF domain-containing protein
MMERISRHLDESRAMHAAAEGALMSALQMRRALVLQLDALSADPAMRRRYRDTMLEHVLEASIRSSRADFGNIQLRDALSGHLLIHTHRGFQRRFLDFFNSVESGQAACGVALSSGRRQIVPDITQSKIFAHGPSLEALLDADVRAVQSTPLIDRSGSVLGVLSTHYSVPYSPDSSQLKFIDYFAQCAVDVIEWHDRSSRPEFF